MKQEPPSRRFRRRGLTLMETVVALGVLAVAVPLVLAAMGTALEVRRDAEVDTRAAFIARSLTADLRAASAGGGRIFHPHGDAFRPRVPLAGDFTESAEAVPVLLGFDRAGGFVRRLSGAEYAAGVAGAELGFLVELTGEADPREARLARVRLQVESPAPAAAAQRHKLRFMVLIASPPAVDEN